MRILLASHSPKDPNGGASRVYHLLEDGLRGRGHTVKALHFQDLGLSGARGKLVSKLRLPEAVSRRAERELGDGWDVVMSSSGMLYPLFERLDGQAGRPLRVSHLHGCAFFDNQATMEEVARGHMGVSAVYRHVTGPMTARWDEAGCRAADLTIVQNGRDEDFLAEKGVGPIVNLPLSVHPEIAAAGMDAPAAEGRDPAAFLWFGSWVERKGCHYLPRAFQLLAARVPGARLTIGGIGMPAEVLRARFAPELRARIQVLPRISLAEQMEVFRRHAVFLFPSLSEGFGFALLEAMAMGLAAVTTDTGLSGDYLTDGVHARIVPKASALHLAEAAAALAEDGALRARMAREGQAMARRFTTERLIDGYEAAFAGHLAQLRSGAERAGA